MALLAIEIENSGEKCGGCYYNYGDAVNEHYRFCRLFQVYLGNSKEKEILRCGKCTAIEIAEAHNGQST